MKYGYFPTKYASFKEVIIAASQKTFVDRVDLKVLYSSLDDVKQLIKNEQKHKVNPPDLLIGYAEAEYKIEVKDENTGEIKEEIQPVIEIELTKGNMVYQIQGERPVVYYLDGKGNQLTIDDINKGIEAINAKQAAERDLLEKELRGDLEKTGIIPVLKNKEKKRMFWEKSQAKLINGLEELSKHLPDPNSRTMATYHDPLTDRITAVEKAVPGFTKELELFLKENEAVKKVLDEVIEKDKEWLPLINGCEVATKTVVDVQEKESKKEESKEEEILKTPGRLYDIRFI